MEVDMTDQINLEEALEQFPEDAYEDAYEDLEDFEPLAFFAALKGALEHQEASLSVPPSANW